MRGMRYFKIGGRRLPIPRSRLLRLSFGILLVLLGFLGFLPILGFWLLPIGLAVLSFDIPYLRRHRRRLLGWWRLRQASRASARSV
jgi:hypothetical protein